MAKPESAPLPYRALVGAVRWVLHLLVIRHWRHLHRVPKQGGVLVISNHTSNFDTITLADAVIAAGRWPRFLGKSEIWKVPGLGWLANECRQIPVERHTERAKQSLVHAEEALAQGDLVAIYPEGTITRDPEGWPMLARHGAARLALKTGVPVIPIAQYGPHKVLGGRYLELRRLFALRRRRIRLIVGDPIEFDDLRSDEPTEGQIHEATRRMTSVLTELYAELRGERTPELIWDPWKSDYVDRRG